jgi:hypothetical protein
MHKQKRTVKVFNYLWLFLSLVFANTNSQQVLDWQQAKRFLSRHTTDHQCHSSVSIRVVIIPDSTVQLYSLAIVLALTGNCENVKYFPARIG